MERTWYLESKARGLGKVTNSSESWFLISKKEITLPVVRIKWEGAAEHSQAQRQLESSRCLGPSPGDSDFIGWGVAWAPDLFKHSPG